jgi:hypothetical protein
VTLRELFWPLLGNWTGVEQLTAGGTARTMVTFKLDVADHVVLQDYRQVRDDGAELTGHGVFLIDPVSGDLLWWFFDSTGIPPTALRGLRIGQELVLGPHREHRFWIENDRLRRTSPGMDGTYRRISGH